VLISNIFDPRYILLDEAVPDAVATDCTLGSPVSRRVDRSPHKKECADSLIQVFNTIRDNYPNLWVVLSTGYRTEVPGFVHVNWKDDLRKITQYLSENLPLALDKMLDVAALHQYQRGISSLQKLRRDIVEEFGLHSLALDFKSGDLQSESVFLVSLRSLLRELLEEQPKLKPAMRQMSFELADRQQLSRYVFQLQWNFSLPLVKAHIKEHLC